MKTISKLPVLLTFLYALATSPTLLAAANYPTTIGLSQINGAEKERMRLAQGHKKFDQQPTGFYVDSGKKVVVKVEILTPAADGASPMLIIGTLGFNLNGRTKSEHALSSGKNTIAATHGGLIYLSYVANSGKSPVGKARITFEAESEHVQAPRYVHGSTSDAEFVKMLVSYPTPDVIYQSPYAVVVATLENAIRYKEKRNEWMQGLHALLEREDEISGMDNSDPNPVHHRLKAGEVRYLLVNNTSPSPHASAAGYTGYPPGAASRYLTSFGSGNNSWMLGHEIGHQHQQPAYQISQATESTVNIYSYVVERSLQGSGYNRTTADKWKKAQETYLRLPVERRVYDMNSDSLQAIIGFNRDELRFMPWEQLFIIFGDEFYRRLHRIVREEEVTGGSEQDRRLYLIWKASQITGYDLCEFFNQWGIRVTEKANVDTLQARIG
ncbi:MAG: M60 family metallopeptidase, partial [Prevotellaceae bacterium]|nr:M60 family metallopeptidase [Prevotellaceae bacterium]